MTAANKAKRRRELKRATKPIPRAGAILLCLEGASWKIDDQAWFAARPTRSFRLRRLHSGEFPAHMLGNATHVIVVQRAPGFREKCLAGDASGGRDLDSMPDSDAVAMALRDEFQKSAASGEPFPLQRAVDRACLMAFAAGNGGVQ